MSAAENTEPITLELPDMVGGTVAVVTLSPGDILVLSSPHHMSYDQHRRIVSTVEDRLPGLKCMVMDSGMAIGGVIRREP